MKTRFVSVDNVSDCADVFKEAAEIINNGGLVAFPTETVYGLGADARNPLAASKIYAAKGRPSNNPLIVHVSEPCEAEEYVYTDSRYYRIAEAFMPGPITVIMPSKNKVAQEVCAGLDTLAIRCPIHPVAREFIRVCKAPIAAPSANTSGRPSPTTAAHVFEDLDGRIDMIIDGGECEFGVESTIIKLDANKCILLRPGAVTYEMLREVLGEVEIAAGVLERPNDNDRVESPGMLISHYAPKAPLYLLKGNREDIIDFMNRKIQTEPNSVVLKCDEYGIDSDRAVSLGAEGDGFSAARRLFASLRLADEKKASEIYAFYPEPEGMGLALLNRMLRASAFKVIEI